MNKVNKCLRRSPRRSGGVLIVLFDVSLMRRDTSGVFHHCARVIPACGLEKG